MSAGGCLGFLNLEILMDYIILGSRMHHCAIFCQRSNGYGDIAIFDFSRWRPSPPSWICFPAFLDHPRGIFGGLYWCAKYGWNSFISFDNMKV